MISERNKTQAMLIIHKILMEKKQKNGNVPI